LRVQGEELGRALFPLEQVDQLGVQFQAKQVRGDQGFAGEGEKGW
jgi:hypothetical protein